LRTVHIAARDEQAHLLAIIRGLLSIDQQRTQMHPMIAIATANDLPQPAATTSASSTAAATNTNTVTSANETAQLIGNVLGATPLLLRQSGFCKQCVSDAR